MPAQTNLLKTLANAIIKFVLPPLVGTLIITIAYTISLQFDSLIQSLEVPFSGRVTSFIRSLYTYYVYYLLVYIPFFIYLTVLKAFGKLKLGTVLVSGFVYGLSPLLFGRRGSVSVDDMIILTVIVISGVLCAGCYYWLDKKLS